jgi:micrococcal nuclease
MNQWKETWAELARPENIPVGVAGGLGILALIAAMTAVIPEPELPPETALVSESGLTEEEVRALIEQRLGERPVPTGQSETRVIQERVKVAEVQLGTVQRVIDGDSLIVVLDGMGEEQVRVQGIDAPEHDQPWGDEAADLLRERIQGRRVSVTHIGERDRHGRLLADIAVPDVENLWDVGVTVTRQGLAWHYEAYDDSRSLAEAQMLARQNRDGLWSDPKPIPPWEGRRR